MKNNTEPKPRRLCIVCDCQSESLHLLQYPGDPEIYVSIHGMNGKPGWLHRLRYCWKILVDGHPYGDQLVLSKESIKELKQYLQLLK